MTFRLGRVYFSFLFLLLRYRARLLITFTEIDISFTVYNIYTRLFKANKSH